MRKRAKKQTSESEATALMPQRPCHASMPGAKVASSKALLMNNSKLSCPSKTFVAPEITTGLPGRKAPTGKYSSSRFMAARTKDASTRRHLNPKVVTASTRTNTANCFEVRNRADVGNFCGPSRKQKRKRMKKCVVTIVDEKIRIKRRVKNLVNRIRQEQNFIDAYSGEGWKGNSREKIRPEKELQRANMQIIQCKLAIRDLIHDLDNLSMEGSLEETAFDEEGRIFHEEIFCAKCKSQEAVKDNDIILCDGACDRGFHQECLDPPLATADIPPGDEGWLCPVCDSKIECLNYMNGYLGTEFQVEDRWETIFAAVAATAAAVVGDASNAFADDWPSDDNDDDYDPDMLVIQDAKDEEGAQDFESVLNSLDSLHGLEGEDTSLGSDLCSDDYFQRSGFGGDQLEPNCSRTQRGDNESGRSLSAKNSGHDFEISKATCGAEDPFPLSRKRERKPVDYKKLNDEMFGLEGADDDILSEDEEWGPGMRGEGKPEGSNDGGRTRRSSTASQRKRSHALRTSPGGQTYHDTQPNHLYSTRKDFNGELFDDVKSRRLPDSAVDILRKEFEMGTSFPTRTVKETFAKELGITVQQVSSWFKNARHAAKNAIRQGTQAVALRKMDQPDTAPNRNSKSSEEEGDDIEFTNGLLVEKLDEVQLKLYYLKQTLEALLTKQGVESESNSTRAEEVFFDSGILVSHANDKHILYVPVAEVVEKNTENLGGLENL